MNTSIPILALGFALVLTSAQVCHAQQPGIRPPSPRAPLGIAPGQPQGANQGAKKLSPRTIEYCSVESQEKSPSVNSQRLRVRRLWRYKAPSIHQLRQQRSVYREPSRREKAESFYSTIRFRSRFPSPCHRWKVPNGAPVQTNFQFQNHTTSGSLLMRPGQAYEILRAGGATYTVTITPEPDK